MIPSGGRKEGMQEVQKCLSVLSLEASPLGCN